MRDYTLWNLEPNSLWENLSNLICLMFLSTIKSKLWKWQKGKRDWDFNSKGEIITEFAFLLL